jgi:hypothetical protein
MAESGQMHSVRILETLPLLQEKEDSVLVRTDAKRPEDVPHSTTNAKLTVF